MKLTFRWFGPDSDPVSLQYIRQIPGVTGIMGTLDYKEAGQVWEKQEISSYMDTVRSAGLECRVIESVNVHEDIKAGLPERDRYIENYCTTLRNLAGFGVEVVIYNFMPVFDWLRTDLERAASDGSTSMYYDEADIAGLVPEDVFSDMLDRGKGFTLPGYTRQRLAEIKVQTRRYEGVSKEDLRRNCRYFLDCVIPVCEECGIRLAIHPDDPAWDISGLPRIAHSREDFDLIMDMNPSACNTICLCTGSLGSDPANNIVQIIRHFGSMGRISCLHVRNVMHLGPRRFMECAHPTECGSLDMYGIMKAVYDTCPNVYIRPDHGRMIWGESGRPGYGLYDRALGYTYIEGLWEAISKLA